MFLKAKIYFTIFSVYEIFAILFLHSKTNCNSIFTNNFCTDSVEKYVIFCVAVPVFVSLVVMWICEIRKLIRRRHSFFFRAKDTVETMASEIKEKVSERLSPQYIERLITAFLIIGVKRFADRNPKTRQVLKDVIGIDIFGEDDFVETRENFKKTKKKK